MKIFKRSATAFVFMAALVCVVTFVFPAKSFAVPPIVDDNLACAGSTFTSIQAAINAAAPGETIRVCEGNYPETITINKPLTILGAQAGNPARPRNNSAAESTIVVGYNTTPPVDIQVDNVTFDGFNFDINQTFPTANGSDKPGTIIRAINDPGGDGYQNIRLLNNRLIYTEAEADTPFLDRNGIFVAESTDLLIEGNYLAGFPGQAVIAESGSTNFVYRNNDTFNNTRSSVSTQGNFTRPAPQLKHFNVLIENNRFDRDDAVLFQIEGGTVRNNSFNGGQLGAGQIYLGGGDNNVTVSGNTFAVSRLQAILSFDGNFGYGPNSNINFTGNTLSRLISPAANGPNSATTGSFAAIDYRGTGGNNTIANNTLRFFGTLPAGGNSTFGIRLRGSASGNFTITGNLLDGGNVTATGTAMPLAAGLNIISNAPAGGATGNTGLFPATSVVNVSCNTFTRFQDGISVFDLVNNVSGGLQPGSDVNVNNNNINGNSQFGINNAGTSQVIDAENNYWGSSTGPGPVGPGSGDRVTANVDFDPFLTAPSQCAPATTRNCGESTSPFDVEEDFTIAANPNCEYSYGVTATRDPNSAFSLYQFATPNVPVAGIDRRHRDNPDPDLVPAIFVNRNNTTTNYFTIQHKPDVLNLHPGPAGERSVLRFAAPTAGAYRVAGRFEGLDTGGTTTDVLILRRAAGGGAASTQLFSANVNGFGNTQTFDFVVVLAAGEIVEFSVGDGGNGYNSDSTGLNAVITLQSSDLSVTKTDSPDPVVAGGDITYTITVNNAGPDAATNVTLTDQIPANTTFQSVTAPTGFTCAAPPQGGTGTVTCTGSTFATGSATFTLVVRVNPQTPGGTVITNTAQVSSATGDATPNNNQASTQTTVVSGAGADLAVSLVVTPDPVQPGGSLTYQLTLTNVGNQTAGFIFLTQTDAVQNRKGSADLTVQSIVAPPGFTCQVGSSSRRGASGDVQCSGESLAPGQSVQFTFVKRLSPTVAAGTVITHQASVLTRATTENNTGNNTAVDSTTVAGGNNTVR